MPSHHQALNHLPKILAQELKAISTFTKLSTLLAYCQLPRCSVGRKDHLYLDHLSQHLINLGDQSSIPKLLISYEQEGVCTAFLSFVRSLLHLAKSRRSSKSPFQLRVQWKAMHSIGSVNLYFTFKTI